jgi:hypothetical protein
VLEASRQEYQRIIAGLVEQEAVKQEQFYILPHPEWTEVIQLRTDNLLRMENPQSPAATVAKLINLRG